MSATAVEPMPREAIACIRKLRPSGTLTMTLRLIAHSRAGDAPSPVLPRATQLIEEAPLPSDLDEGAEIPDLAPLGFILLRNATRVPAPARCG
jgi:hypothetical protein